MRKAIPFLAAFMFYGVAGAVPMDSMRYHIYFGNPDGSPIVVGLDQDIEIPVFASTDPDNQEDSVGHMHIPLATDGMIITERLGGFFPPSPGVGGWDEIEFHSPSDGNQSILGFHYLYDPYDPQNLLFTNGEIQLIATYRMHTTSDPSYLSQTLSPFAIGWSPVMGGLIWANQGYEPSEFIVPRVHLGSLYFTSTPFCPFEIGDANGNETYNGLDVTYSVNFLKGIGDPPPDACDCYPHGMIYPAADANGNCTFNGLDVTYSVNYLKGFGEAPLGCADCPPGE